MRGVGSIFFSAEPEGKRTEQTPAVQQATATCRFLLCGVRPSCFVHILNVLFQVAAVVISIADLASERKVPLCTISQIVVSVIVVATSAVGAKAWYAIPWDHHKEKVLFMLLSRQALVSLLGYSLQLVHWYIFWSHNVMYIDSPSGTHFPGFCETAVVAYLVTMISLLALIFLVHLGWFAWEDLGRNWGEGRTSQYVSPHSDQDVPVPYSAINGDTDGLEKGLLDD